MSLSDWKSAALDLSALPAQDRRLVLLAGLAARDRHADLHSVLVAELEERAEPAGSDVGDGWLHWKRGRSD